MYLRGRKILTTGAVAGLSIVLAACGSQLSPETVAAVNGGGAVGGVSQGVVGEDGVPVAGDPGALGGADVAAGGGVSTGYGSGGSAAGGDAGTGGSGSGGGSATQGGGANAPGGTTKAGSCDGFKNQTGVTDDKIVIANVSDISGPVPGIFEASQDATKAYVAYFNATSDICGRKLEVMALDSRADAGAGQQAYAKACEGAFAAVGSMSAFDGGGAPTAEKCGLPDLRSAAVEAAANECSTCFGTQSANFNEFQNAVPDHFLKNYREGSQKAAYLWINAGASGINAQNQATAMQKRGMKFVYKQGIDVSEFNYAPYVQQMKEKGVRIVFWQGAYQQAVRLAQAMKQQGFEPDAYVQNPIVYDPRYVESGGSDVDGTLVYTNFAMFDEPNKEMLLYRQWLQQVRPGATPTFFGVFSWSATRLFVEQAIALGGRLSRDTLIDSVRKVDKWTANDLHGPQRVGSKRVGDCWRFIQLKGGKWVPVGGTKYSCNGVTQVG